MTLTAAVPLARRRRSFLHVGLGLLVTAMVLIGFWPGYYGSLLRSIPVDRPLVVHVHAAVFSGWLVIFVAQTVLAATGRIRAHLRFGQIGVWYGAALIVVGVYTAVVRSAVLPVGERELNLWVTLVDMAVFAALFGAALWFRRAPEVHKRLMTAAAVSLAIAAVARLGFLPKPPARQFVAFFLWSAPVFIAIASDARHARRPHPAYVLTLVLFAFRLWSPLMVVATPQWRELTARILALGH